MKRYINQLQQWTHENLIEWEYLPQYGNLFGDYLGGDVSLCRLVAGSVYYKLIVNSYTCKDGGTVTFYIMRHNFYFPLVEELRRVAIRRAKRIET